MKRIILLIALVAFQTAFVFGQEDQPKRFDFGKMWTFENPPKEWFTEAYDFSPEDEWFDDVRMSALRFATWCSASFVSPDGLIMTNHHCSRGVVGDLQKDGESFDNNGFYASTLGDERKAEGLFVEQLIKVADVSTRVLGATTNESNAQRANEKKDSVLAVIQAEYGDMEGWEGLRLQVVSYYSGGKYSLYGYKKYDDIRLVMIPEMQLGYYGGDPDNFTFPRYNLDCTFWRAYGDDGKPLNTSDHYFKFNEGGADEGDPVFVIGNPGRTERYRTSAQLAYDRDYRYPAQLTYLGNRHEILSKEYETNPSDELMNNIFGISNTIKAFTGILKGLQDESLFARKQNMENSIKSKSSNKKIWADLENYYVDLNKHGGPLTILGPSQIKGDALNLMYAANGYGEMLSSGEATEEELTKAREEITTLSKDLNSSKQLHYLSTLLGEMEMFEHPDNKFMSSVLNGKSAKDAAANMIEDSWFAKPDKLAKLMKLSPKKWAKCDDPILEASRIIVPKYQDAVTAFRSTSADRRALEAQVANEVFKVKGTDLPPDATFTLRLADGVVKGYDYNGTTAPHETTYFGMYDRHYSNGGEFPWNLPEKWMNPSMDLLKSPCNFVSTNDIIGGNSGSAIVNKDREVVGLVFDGNIESLPGNFIFDDEYNRTVSVHAGGIVAALRYVYKADRLVTELVGK